LVKLLSNRLAPLSGDLRRSNKIRIGYFAQHQTEEMDVTRTPFQLMQETMGFAQPEPKVRAALGRFGFDRHKADTKVELLSGGEKARLLLCLMSFNAPHIMLLDEPTNHLDMDSREALMQALNNYKGAIILVSHDPHLVECVADRLWLVAEGNCVPYEGDIDEYRQLVIRQRRKERSEARQAGKSKKGSESKNPLEKHARECETKVAELTKKRDQIENEIADYSSTATKDSGHRLKDLNLLLKSTLKDLQTAEEAWLRAQEELEAGKA
jgi:ATP-binding cassette subfamily F protein 3